MPLPESVAARSARATLDRRASDRDVTDESGTKRDSASKPASRLSPLGRRKKSQIRHEVIAVLLLLETSEGHLLLRERRAKRSDILLRKKKSKSERIYLDDVLDHIKVMLTSVLVSLGADDPSTVPEVRPKRPWRLGPTEMTRRGMIRCQSTSSTADRGCLRIGDPNTPAVRGRRGGLDREDTRQADEMHIQRWLMGTMLRIHGQCVHDLPVMSKEIGGGRSAGDRMMARTLVRLAGTEGVALGAAGLEETGTLLGVTFLETHCVVCVDRIEVREGVLIDGGGRDGKTRAVSIYPGEGGRGVALEFLLGRLPP
ncbi:hypothetical protein L1887_62644 [Cichorium endivia]|nr:hypothetical protein L1887_62644 [Cichorium endivia]